MTSVVGLPMQVTNAARPVESNHAPAAEVRRAVSAWIDAAAVAAGVRDREFTCSPFAAAVQRLESDRGPAARAAFLRGVLQELVDRQRPRIRYLVLPDSVKALIEGEYRRIEHDLATAADAHFDLTRHSMRCDFRIVGFGRIPVGLHHIEVGGIPRRLAWSGGLAQACRFAAVIAEAGGWAPFYVSHFAHGIDRRSFRTLYTPEALAAWHRNAAECLRCNPHVRGLLATSWWYDPQLVRVAPHLAFLREGSMAHGAVQLRAGSTAGALRDALANSSVRQRLHAAGEYMPCSYAMVWTRQALMAWAGRG